MINFKWMTRNRMGSVTVADRILEMSSWVLAVFLIVLAVALYRYLPERIPVHFNAVGEADEWGDRGMIFVLMALGLAAMAICSAAAYNYKMVNLPFSLNPACLPRQVTVIGRMMRVLSVLCGWLFIALMLMTAAPPWGMQSVCFSFFLVVVAGMILVLMVYTVLIYKIGRRYR